MVHSLGAWHVHYRSDNSQLLVWDSTCLGHAGWLRWIDIQGSCRELGDANVAEPWRVSVAKDAPTPTDRLHREASPSTLMVYLISTECNIGPCILHVTLNGLKPIFITVLLLLSGNHMNRSLVGSDHASLLLTSYVDVSSLVNLPRLRR
jgi:hypothetical protein